MQKICVLFALTIALITGSCATAASEEWKSDRIYFDVKGAGEPVIIIPGLTSSPDVFQKAFTLTDTSKHTYHFATLGGFGGKPAPKDLTAFTQPVAGELVRYLEEQDLTKVALIGHSMGGIISLLSAAQKTNRIDRILIIDSVPFFAKLLQPGITPEQAALRKDAIVAQFNAMSDAEFATTMRQGLPIQATSPEAQSIVWADIERSDRRAIAIASAEIFSTDYSKILENIKAKVTVLVPHNAFSPGTPQQILRRYQALYEGTEHIDFKIIEDSRHFIMLDQPDAFAHEISIFLEGSESE